MAKSQKTSKKSKGRNAYVGGLYADAEQHIRKTCKGVITMPALIAFLAILIGKKRAKITDVNDIAKQVRRRCKGRSNADTLKRFQGEEACLSAARSTANVILGPRPMGKDQSKAKAGQILNESGNGDCRGNLSSRGHLYFMRPLAIVIDKVTGKKEPRRLRWFWRKPELAKMVRSVTSTVVDSKKTAKATKAKKTAKKSAKAKSSKSSKSSKSKAKKAPKKSVKAKSIKTSKTVKTPVAKATPAPAAPVEPVTPPVEPVTPPVVAAEKTEKTETPVTV